MLTTWLCVVLCSSLEAEEVPAQVIALGDLKHGKVDTAKNIRFLDLSCLGTSSPVSASSAASVLEVEIFLAHEDGRLGNNWPPQKVDGIGLQVYRYTEDSSQNATFVLLGTADAEGLQDFQGVQRAVPSVPLAWEDGPGVICFGWSYSVSEWGIAYSDGFQSRDVLWGFSDCEVGMPCEFSERGHREYALTVTIHRNTLPDLPRYQGLTHTIHVDGEADMAFNEFAHWISVASAFRRLNNKKRPVQVCMFGTPARLRAGVTSEFLRYVDGHLREILGLRIFALFGSSDDNDGTNLRRKTGPFTWLDLGKQKTGMQEGEDSEVCDAVVFSFDSWDFSFERARPLLQPVSGFDNMTDFALIVYIPHGCEPEPTPIDSNDALHCHHIISLWKSTVCGHDTRILGADYGSCLEGLCFCGPLPRQAIMDPHHIEIDCDDFGRRPNSSVDEDGWRRALAAGQSQWHQDWFLFHNFFFDLPSVPPPVYVDIGANQPFMLSNTAVFDQCFGWAGLCIEPNPEMSLLLRRYRTCKVARNCVAEEHREELFVGSATELASMSSLKPASQSDVSFKAKCWPLKDLLLASGLQGRTIHVLSVDVEGAEQLVFRSFPFKEFDIRVIVVETTAESTRALDVVLLTEGYAKTAMLGKDFVYVRQDIFVKAFPSGRDGLLLPPPFVFQSPYEEKYTHFQRRFIDPRFGEMD